MTLPPGSVLVIDAQAGDGEAFGEARLIAMLNATPERSAACLLDEIMAAVDRFTGDTPQTDDIAVLVRRYSGPALQ